MTDAFALVGGQRATPLRLCVPNVGPWYVDADLEEAPALAGRLAIEIGALTLSGTVDPRADGTHGLRRKCRVVAGAGGWGTPIAAKGYHNDALVKARNVADDAARAVGETLGTFVPAAERVGADYVRQLGPASRTLEDVVGGVPWWVDYAGVTHVGPRPAVQADPSTYEVLAYDPRTRLATLAVDDPSAITIGSILSERLDAPQTVRELELVVTANEMRVYAWCGGAETRGARLPDTLRRIVEHVLDRRLYGKYRYRVFDMLADGRVNLQAVRKAAGLPDLLPVAQWPGVAGTHAELTPGAEVLVEFIEGDRADPVVTHYAGKGGQGFEPVSLDLGGVGGQKVGRQGDLVRSGGLGATVQLLPVPPSAPGPVATGTLYLISFGPPTPAMPQVPLYGAVATGSSKVRSK